MNELQQFTSRKDKEMLCDPKQQGKTTKVKGKLGIELKAVMDSVPRY